MRRQRLPERYPSSTTTSCVREGSATDRSTDPGADFARGLWLPRSPDLSAVALSFRLISLGIWVRRLPLSRACVSVQVAVSTAHLRRRFASVAYPPWSPDDGPAGTARADIVSWWQARAPTKHLHTWAAMLAVA